MQITEISSHCSPLHAAARNGHANMVPLLLSAGANAEARDCIGHTAMHAAARDGHAAAVEQLLAFGADWSLVDNRGFTPLRPAAKWGHIGVAELLVGSGADSQKALLEAAQTALARGHMCVWAFLVRSIHSRYGDAVEHCLQGVSMAEAVKALAGGWQGEVDHHEEVLGAARRERVEGEEARGQAQQLLIQIALLQKQVERKR